MTLRDDRGTGLLGTALGIGMFIGLLLVAVQVLTHLHTVAVVEAAAYDAVQWVSAAAGTDVDGAEAQARDLLGGLSPDATFDWGVDGEDIVLEVSVRRPEGVPVLSAALGLHTVEREYRMRMERFR